MGTTGAVSKTADPIVMNSHTNGGTSAQNSDEIENENVDGGLAQLVVVDNEQVGAAAKSTGVGSTDSNDSGLAGDHSSPEHDHAAHGHHGHGYGNGKRSSRQRPRSNLKMPAYPGFGAWNTNQNINEDEYYDYDKLSPMADGNVDTDYAVDTNFGSHIVYVHVNVGETLSVRVGEDVQHIPGPATVRMVTSRHAGPPAPLPLHVPPGHIVQQILDEYGTLRHLVLSPQTPLQPNTFAGPFQIVNMPNGYTTPTVPYTDTNGSPSFYDGNFYAVSPVPSNLDDLTATGVLEQCEIDCVQNQEYQESYKPEPPFRRSYKNHLTTNGPMDDQTRTVPPRIGGRRKRYGMVGRGQAIFNQTNDRPHYVNDRFTNKSTRFENDRNRYSARNDGGSFRSQKNSYQNGYHKSPTEEARDHAKEAVKMTNLLITTAIIHDDDETTMIKDMLSRIPLPTVRDIGSRSAFVQWQPFDCSEASANGGSFPNIDASEFTYEIMVFEHQMDEKPAFVEKSQADIFPQKCLANLKPARDYFVKIRASLEEREISGEPSAIVAFRTKPCQPDAPQPPTLIKRAKSWLLLAWDQASENGCQITNYHLEIHAGDQDGPHQFEEIYAGLVTQYKVQDLDSDTLYQVRLAASNSYGKSDYSDVLKARTSGGPPEAPNPPSLVSATPKSVTLQWTRRECDEEFQLYMDDGETGFNQIITTRDAMYSVPNLCHSHGYNFRLSASNEDGQSEPSETVLFRTSPPEPSAPSKPTASEVNSNKAKITWKRVNAGTSDVNYVLEMAVGDVEKPKWTAIYEGRAIEFEVCNLEPGTRYQFRVACLGDGGRGEVSDVLDIVTPAAAPGVCGRPALKVKPESTALHLMWSSPAVNGGSQITEYELSMADPTSAEYKKNQLASDRLVYRGLCTEFLVSSGLQAGCTYTFRVRAYNAIGVGQWSDFLECQTSAAPPDTPQRLRLVELNATNASLTWDPPAFNNGSPVMEYLLYCACRKLGSVPQSAATPIGELEQAWTIDPTSPAAQEISMTLKNARPDFQCLRQLSTASDASDDCVFSTESDVGTMTEIYAGSELHFDAKSLTPATEYAFCIQAINYAGKSRLSSALFCRTPADVPDAPRIMKVDPISMTEIDIRWDAAVDNGSAIISYHLEVMPSEFGDYGSNIQFPIALPAHCRQYVVENLLSSKMYRIRVQAVNDIGAGVYSSAVEASTLSPPPAPPKLELVSASYSSLKLKWSSNSSHDEDTIFTLEMENKTGAFSPLATELTTRSYKVVRLCESTAYRFRIRACSLSGGVGQWSDVYAFTTSRAPPASVKYAPRISNVSETACEIDWQPSKLNSLPLNSNEKLHYHLQIRAAFGNSGDMFETVYKGPSTNFNLTGLASGATYKARVFSVRVSDSGDETESGPSPISSFTTITSASISSTPEDEDGDAFATKVISAVGLNLMYGEDRQLSDRQWAVLILVAFSLVALFVACILQRFIPDGSANVNAGTSGDPFQMGVNGAG